MKGFSIKKAKFDITIFTFLIRLVFDSLKYYIRLNFINKEGLTQKKSHYV